MSQPLEAPPEPVVDTFEQAFDRIMEEATPATPAEAPPAAAEAPAEAPAAIPAAPVVAETPAEAPATAPVPVDELKTLLTTLVDQTRAPAPAPEVPETPDTPAEAPAAIYSSDEQTLLTTYEKEWPEVAQGEALKRRAEYQHLVQHIFNEITKEYGPAIEMVRAMSEQTHVQQLQHTVSDYDTVRDQVIAWAQTQPAYLQPAYQHVIQRGTVDEVADLINRWRAETGTAVAAPVAAASVPATPAKRTDTELPTATKQAAAALAPVSSKRSTIAQEADPNDFESAFSHFADKP